jgi:hypothetical protein
MKENDKRMNNPIFKEHNECGMNEEMKNIVICEFCKKKLHICKKCQKHFLGMSILFQDSYNDFCEECAKQFINFISQKRIDFETRMREEFINEKWQSSM